jgi:hypothetical protein
MPLLRARQTFGSHLGGPCEPAPIFSLSCRHRWQPGDRVIAHRRDHDGRTGICRDALTPPGTNDAAPNDAATASTSATPSADSLAHIAAAAAGSLSLSIKSTGGPVAGRFFQDIGSYALTGAATDLDDGTAIEIYRRTASEGWTLQASTRLTAESYSATLPVRERGTFTFVSTTGGAPGSGDEIASNEVVITVEDSKITLDQPVAKIDSLKNPTISGTIVPARSGVEIQINVKRSGTYQTAETTTTDSSRPVLNLR